MNLRRLPSSSFLRGLTAALLLAGGASAHADTVLAERSPMNGEGLKPEATFGQRIDPWSRWSLRLRADPSLGLDAGAESGMDFRFVTERLSAHELQAGATMAFAPTEPDDVLPWQTFDDQRPSLFMQDSWQCAPQVSVTAGARVVDTPEGSAWHQRLSVEWQPASDWTVRLTDGAIRLGSPHAGGLDVQRFQGVELETEQAAGSLRMQARLASHVVNDALQPQVLHAAALTLSAPLDDHWTLDGDSLITSQGNFMRLRLSGSLAHDRAKLSLVVPRRFQGRAIDPMLNGGLPSLDAGDELGWRTQLEVRF